MLCNFNLGIVILGLTKADMRAFCTKGTRSVIFYSECLIWVDVIIACSSHGYLHSGAAPVMASRSCYREVFQFLRETLVSVRFCASWRPDGKQVLPPGVVVLCGVWPWMIVLACGLMMCRVRVLRITPWIDGQLVRTLWLYFSVLGFQHCYYYRSWQCSPTFITVRQFNNGIKVLIGKYVFERW
jgi:hypothetical protein